MLSRKAVLTDCLTTKKTSKSEKKNPPYWTGAAKLQHVSLLNETKLKSAKVKADLCDLCDMCQKMCIKSWFNLQ